MPEAGMGTSSPGTVNFLSTFWKLSPMPWLGTDSISPSLVLKRTDLML